MANTTGFLGLKQIGYLPGGAPDYQLQSKLVSSANATAIYRGDAVVFSSGYIIAATAGTASVDGVFDGCTFTDSSGNTKWQPFCPASQTATAYIISAPNALFLGQSNGTAISQANINSNIGFLAAAGTTIGGGFSGYTLNAATIGTNSAAPFRIVNLFSAYSPSGVNGTDNASNYNMAVVCFNNQDFKSGQTGA